LEKAFEGEQNESAEDVNRSLRDKRGPKNQEKNGFLQAEKDIA
jgi:hypothetical protein